MTDQKTEPQEAPDAKPAWLRSERKLTVSTVQHNPSADCDEEECDFDTGEVPSALMQAIEHAQSTGHSVRLHEDTETVIEVWPR